MNVQLVTEEKVVVTFSPEEYEAMCEAVEFTEIALHHTPGNGKYVRIYRHMLEHISKVKKVVST